MTDNSPAQQGQYSTVSISSIRVGCVLRAPLYDANSSQQVLLLAAGARITKSQLERLRRRGVTTVRVHSRDLGLVVDNGNHVSIAVPKINEEERSTGAFNVSRDSFVHSVKDHGGKKYESEQMDDMAETYSQSTLRVKSLFYQLAQKSGADGEAAVHVTTGALEELAEDLDLFVRLSINRDSNQEVYRHGLKSARIALAIGTVMGLPKERLLDLGIGCLIHDVGMSKVDQDLVGRKDRINSVDFLDIMKHPIYTYDMLMEMWHVPPGARMVAYQIHERWDGSGYPRQRHGMQIHPLARIGAVADAFAAMISDRPHRPALPAREAMAQILIDMRKGLFDPEVVRGLLNTVSLFPIGSVVEVSDGRVGIVVRANRADYCRPIVEVWAAHSLDEPGEIVDLAEISDLQIIRSMPNSDPKLIGATQLWEAAMQAELATVE